MNSCPSVGCCLQLKLLQRKGCISPMEPHSTTLKSKPTPSRKRSTQMNSVVVWDYYFPSHIALFGPFLPYWAFACILWSLILCFYGVCMCVCVCVTMFLMLFLLFI